MSVSVRSVDYFYTTVEDRPGEAYGLLSRIAEGEINLLALAAVPVGPVNTQFTLFPESSERLLRLAERHGWVLTGPNRALLITGDDRLGALVDFHHRLAEAHINVYASNGVADGKDGYGYIMHVRPEDHDRALNILQMA